MIALLSGTPHFENSQAMIIDVHGVGYEVYVSPSTRAHCQALASVTLHIHTAVREDALELYGFQSSAEKEVFLLLLTVSGVGPRTALAITSHPAQSIVNAVQQADVSFFSAVPRIGKKLAQKIIIELTSKLGSLKELNLTPLSDRQETVAQALQALGYNEEQSRATARELDSDEPVERVIQKAIKQLSERTLRRV